MVDIADSKSSFTNIKKVMARYANQDFVVQLKIKFIYYLILSEIVALTIAILLTTYTQLIIRDDALNYPILLSEIFILLIFFICFFMLLKGYYRPASTLILIVSFMAIWAIIILDKNDSLTRFDTVVYLLAILSSTPILIGTEKRLIFLYTLANIIILIIFVASIKDQTSLSSGDLHDFLFDTSIAILFIGVTAYANFRINKKALEKVYEDIKERKKAEELLARSEKKFREMAELLPQTIFEVDLSGKLTYINKNGLERFGYNDEDVKIGTNVLTALHPNEHQRANENLKKLLDSNHVTANQYNAIAKDGSIIEVQISTSLITEDGKPVGYRGVIVDISERINAEKEIKKSEERFKSMIELLPYSVMVLDMERRHLLVNENYCKEVGLSKDEIIGKSVLELDFSLNPEAIKQIYQALEKQGFALNIEARFTNRFKNEGYILMSSKMIQFNNIQAVLSTSINITDRKKIEQELDLYRQKLEFLVKQRTDELEAANEELQTLNNELYDKNEIINKQYNELKSTLKNLQETQSQLIEVEKMASLGVLTAGIAHEINNPLNFIMGGCEGLENYFNSLVKSPDEDVLFLLDSIRTGVNRTSALVSSLNQFNRDRNSYGEICVIHEIIDNSIVMLGNKLKNRIEVVKNYTKESCITIGNVGKMHQVFLNILLNSVQSIKNEGKIRITTSATKDIVTVEIADSGIGISKDNLSKITDPFFTTKDPGEGTGLGLSISYSIIKEHNGSIRFESELNIGTHVYITLPLKR